MLLNFIRKTKNRAWIYEELFLDYIDTVLIKYKPKTKKLLIYKKLIIFK